MEQAIITLIGNINLISNEEEILVKYLKDANLSRVNETAQTVHVRDTVYTRYIKRILDLALAIPAFAITLPFNLVFGICTYFDVGRPIFYKQVRTGKDGVPFLLVKFRNMNEVKDADGKLLPARERVTKFGKFMRKLSLDELLNFWSILKGDMSIIGPRPLPAAFTERMSERHKMRSAVRPGLECPRIINDDLSQSKYQTQFENDIWYVENVSFITDVRMTIKLIRMAFDMKHRSGNASADSGYFAGYDEDGTATTVKRFKRLHSEMCDIFSRNQGE